DQECDRSNGHWSHSRKDPSAGNNPKCNSVVSLSVQDSGPGITPENGTHVFDPFFTTKSSGTGLGLSISQRIIQDHGGELRLTKTSSNGCTFEITLPSVATSDSGNLRRTIAAVGSPDKSPALPN
ncbi:MAG: ATP-binding protein, partial [Pseudolabrys sp.]